jgi:maltose alpha-D-glucosyltransferase/alpha-amylase
MPDFGPPPRRIEVDGPLDAGRVAVVVAEVTARSLPELLPTRRWFGEKDRRVRSVALDDIAVVEVAGDWVGLAVVGVTLDRGEAVAYFVPLSVVAAPPHDAAVLATLRTGDHEYAVIDAFEAPSFATWFLDGFAAGRDLRTNAGRLSWRRLSGLSEDALNGARVAAPRLGTAEQSNTAVLYGDQVFLKVVRRLRTGVNPDEEIGTYLATRTGFRRLPLPLGGARYVDAAGDGHPIAFAQSFVPNVGDGWSFALRLLSTAPQDFPTATAALGTRTAELHLALGQATEEPDFAPEVVSEQDEARWEASLRQRLAAVVSDLRRTETTLDASLVGARDVLLARLPELERRAEGFRHQIGGSKIRVHGDYHLGQVLRTPDEDWTILDFEGEPLRPIVERRAKTSPLKDVTGMLRSFGYARSAVLRRGAGSHDSAAIVDAEAAARRVFLAAYRGTLDRSSSDLVPRSPEAFGAAVAAWELDKAVYELRYELSNRPDWIAHALTTLTETSVPGAASG